MTNEPRVPATVGTTIEWDPGDGYGVRVGVVEGYANEVPGDPAYVEGARPYMRCRRIDGPRKGVKFYVPVVTTLGESHWTERS